jgi:hypothetical protein
LAVRSAGRNQRRCRYDRTRILPSAGVEPPACPVPARRNPWSARRVIPDDLARFHPSHDGRRRDRCRFDVGIHAFSVIVLGAYLAAHPELYVGAVARLFAPRYRPRIRDAMNELGVTLGWRLTGRASRWR